MKPIITSILDTDLYKMTQQWFVLQTYPEVDVTYVFNNRNKNMKFTDAAYHEIMNQVEAMKNLKLTDKEYDWIRDNLPFLPIAYRQYLSAYQFNPTQVEGCINDGNLEITIRGKWRDTILWEVPLMAIISEVYFAMVDTDWNYKYQQIIAETKAEQLASEGIAFADFGTRRRRSFQTQDLIVETMSRHSPNFVGTSNPLLAMVHGVKALGTVAHESIMATTVLESVNHPNKFFMENWTKVYNGDLGTMLPDTYGIDSFLQDFTLEKAKTWDGVRHDSGDPKVFVDKIIAHYKKMRIDPTTKTIIFSDGLDVNTACDIAEYCKGKIRASFGIGTNFTNSFMKASAPTEKSKALNMVIKLNTVNGKPVVKLSDSPGKAIGDPTMVKIMKYLHFGETFE